MPSLVKDWAARASHRMQAKVGYRFLRTKRFGLDWLDDASRIARQGWHPSFTKLDVVFDVGANVGQTASKLVQRISPQAIYSFEPVESTFAQLQANTKSLTSVHCLNYGLSDVNANSSIHIYESSVYASTCDRTPVMSPENETYLRTETIKLKTLDKARAELGVEKIDLLKIDTEGADLRTIQGAQASLQSKAIGLIVFEFYRPSDATGASGTLFPVDEALVSHGYRLVAFYTDHVHPDRATGIYNALYMPEPQ
ncbi:FkbM family methyltransferase [Novipirellula caenicola]|uniref:Methyltransferase FkbM domain-containing protein n=1 Tax=Novipirellula caenicola TaxID=1536901 RepID=A0ABP9VXK5_9BACT